MCAHPRYFWKIPRTCAIVHIHLHLWNHQICYQKNVASNICDCSSIQEGTIKVFPTHFPEARSKVTACKFRRHIPKLSLSLTFPHLVNRTPRCASCPMHTQAGWSNAYSGWSNAYSQYESSKELGYPWDDLWYDKIRVCWAGSVDGVFWDKYLILSLYWIHQTG